MRRPYNPVDSPVAAQQCTAVYTATHSSSACARLPGEQPRHDACGRVYALPVYQARVVISGTYIGGPGPLVMFYCGQPGGTPAVITFYNIVYACRARLVGAAKEVAVFVPQVLRRICCISHQRTKVFLRIATCSALWSRSTQIGPTQT